MPFENDHFERAGKGKIYKGPINRIFVKEKPLAT